MITFDNFDMDYLNPGLFTGFIICAFLVFSILTSYPLEFWRKTPFMFSLILAIYEFHVIMLCPNSNNDY